MGHRSLTLLHTLANSVDEPLCTPGSGVDCSWLDILHSVHKVMTTLMSCYCQRTGLAKLLRFYDGWPG